MMALVQLARGMGSDMWAPLTEVDLPNLAYLRPQLLSYDGQGRLVGVGAVSWCKTLVTNSDVFPNAPTSWSELWGDHPNQEGLLVLPINSYLLEITTTNFFGGTDILDTEDAILQVVRQARRIGAERAALVPRRGPVPAGAAVGRDPDGGVPPRRDWVGGSRGFPETREFLTLTDGEFAIVSCDITPIIPRYDIYLERGDWVNQVWSERVTG